MRLVPTFEYTSVCSGCSTRYAFLESEYNRYKGHLYNCQYCGLPNVLDKVEMLNHQITPIRESLLIGFSE
jgi:hypothetical protein